jgi:hypothetical protein
MTNLTAMAAKEMLAEGEAEAEAHLLHNEEVEVHPLFVEEAGVHPLIAAEGRAVVAIALMTVIVMREDRLVITDLMPMKMTSMSALAMITAGDMARQMKRRLPASREKGYELSEGKNESESCVWRI